MKTTLYLGTDPSEFAAKESEPFHLIHYPLIKVVQKELSCPEVKQAFDDIEGYTHLIFTSKNAVAIFMDHLATLEIPVHRLGTKNVIAVGQVTAAHLHARGLPAQHTAKEETQEGVVQLLQGLDLENAYLFMPRSSLSRPVIVNYLQECQIRYQACDIYDTLVQRIEPKPDLSQIDEIVFTSPSTVRAFIEIFGQLPKEKKCVPIGPVTEKLLFFGSAEIPLGSG